MCFWASSVSRDVANIDLLDAAEEKLRLNAEKYPPGKASRL